MKTFTVLIMLLLSASVVSSWADEDQPSNFRSKIVSDLNILVFDIYKTDVYSHALSCKEEIEIFVPHIVSWKEIGFSQQALDEELHYAHIRDIERRYESLLLKDKYSLAKKEARGIAGDVLQAKIDPGYLSFTGQDLKNAVHTAQVRELEILYLFLHSDTNTYDNKAFLAKQIFETVDSGSGSVKWSDLSYDHWDLWRLLGNTILKDKLESDQPLRSA
jgi:hypothetical protein